MENKLSKAMWSLCRSYLLFALCLFSLWGFAQSSPTNLAPNGGFEEYSFCPTVSSGLSTVDYWSYAISTANYFHVCGSAGAGVQGNLFGTQIPMDSAYVGVASYYTGFAGNQEVAVADLLTPLTANEKYRVRFKASYADSANYAVCCVGVILASSAPPQGPYTQNLSSVELVLEESDFDTTTWFQYDGVYTAQGGEDKIYLGSFRPEADMNPINVRPNGDPNYDIAYFYIDDVEVYEDTFTGVDETEERQVNLVYEQQQGRIRVNGQLTLSVFDLSGKKMRAGTGSLDVNDLSGVYIVRVLENGVAVHVEKMVFIE